MAGRIPRPQGYPVDPLSSLPEETAIPCPAPLIEFTNITVIKGGTKILDRVSLTVGEGESIAILGPNGAGKSSLIKTINREYYPAPSNRRVVFRVRGKEVWDVFDLRAAFGIVSNDLQVTFSRNLPAREVVISGFFSSVGLFRHTVTPRMERKADELMDFLGVLSLADRPMTSLSSGEARRVLIARALVHEPKTLILDEPASNLDLTAQHTLRATLRAIARSGTGIIMATHNLHDIIPEISRVILMNNGRFVADGKKEEVITGRRVGRLFRITLNIRKDGGWFYATGY